VNKTYIVVRH